MAANITSQNNIYILKNNVQIDVTYKYGTQKFDIEIRISDFQKLLEDIGEHQLYLGGLLLSNEWPSETSGTLTGIHSFSHHFSYMKNIELQLDNLINSLSKEVDKINEKIVVKQKLNIFKKVTCNNAYNIRVEYQVEDQITNFAMFELRIDFGSNILEAYRYIPTLDHFGNMINHNRFEIQFPRVPYTAPYYIYMVCPQYETFLSETDSIDAEMMCVLKYIYSDYELVFTNKSYEINNTPLCFSPNHKILTKDNTYKEIQYVNPSDIISKYDTYVNTNIKDDEQVKMTRNITNSNDSDVFKIKIEYESNVDIEKSHIEFIYSKETEQISANLVIAKKLLSPCPETTFTTEWHETNTHWIRTIPPYILRTTLEYEIANIVKRFDDFLKLITKYKITDEDYENCKNMIYKEIRKTKSISIKRRMRVKFKNNMCNVELDCYTNKSLYYVELAYDQWTKIVNIDYTFLSNEHYDKKYTRTWEKVPNANWFEYSESSKYENINSIKEFKLLICDIDKIMIDKASAMSSFYKFKYEESIYDALDEFNKDFSENAHVHIYSQIINNQFIIKYTLNYITEYSNPYICIDYNNETDKATVTWCIPDEMVHGHPKPSDMKKFKYDNGWWYLSEDADKIARHLDSNPFREINFKMKNILDALLPEKILHFDNVENIYTKCITFIDTQKYFHIQIHDFDYHRGNGISFTKQYRYGGGGLRDLEDHTEPQVIITIPNNSNMATISYILPVVKDKVELVQKFVNEHIMFQGEICSKYWGQYKDYTMYQFARGRSDYTMYQFARGRSISKEVYVDDKNIDSIIDNTDKEMKNHLKRMIPDCIFHEDKDERKKDQKELTIKEFKNRTK
jgi:hypothetical protein